jgi:peroxiredoxin
MAVLLPTLLLAMTTLAVDLNGRPVTQLATPGTQAVVLFFAASDCPVSNRYIPEIQQLIKQFEPQGVRVWFVYPNPSDTADVVRAHDLEFSLHADTALDTSQTLTRMAHATTTPEAAVFVPRNGALQEVYRGRIDDRYLALGTERPHATHHDLEEAIRAVLAGKLVPQPGGPPVGCSIVTLHP